VETSRPESRGIKSELKCEKTLEYDLAKSNQKHGERAGSIKSKTKSLFLTVDNRHGGTIL
jgi:hypothetical protein